MAGLALALAFLLSAAIAPAAEAAQFLTKWGAPGSGDGEFSSPFGIATDAGDNVYVADTFNHRIQKFDSSGNFLTKWGSFGTGDGEFNDPTGVATDTDGNVYVAKLGGSRVQRFDSDGNFLAKWGSIGSGDGEFRNPSDLATDTDGNVYVVEAQGNRVQKFDPRDKPATKEACKKGGYAEHGYSNQGRCVAATKTAGKGN